MATLGGVLGGDDLAVCDFVDLVPLFVAAAAAAAAATEVLLLILFLNNFAFSFALGVEGLPLTLLAVLICLATRGGEPFFLTS